MKHEKIREAFDHSASTLNNTLDLLLQNYPVADSNFVSRQNKTLNIIEAASFLGAHKETVRRMVVRGLIPAVKVGRSWRFIEEDLVLYMRSQYSGHVTSQGAVNRSEKEWRFTKEMRLGGSASPIMDKEYNEALGLRVK